MYFSVAFSVLYCLFCVLFANFSFFCVYSRFGFKSTIGASQLFLLFAAEWYYRS